MKLWIVFLFSVAPLIVLGEERQVLLARWFRCPERCGLFGSRRRRVNPADGSCVQRCFFFPRVFRRGWDCGSCADWEAAQTGFQTTMDVSAVNDDSLQTVFTSAADQWSSVITGDLPSASIGLFGRWQSSCRARNIPSVIDDMFICGVVGPIDGELGVLGQAGAEFVRVDSRIPVLGAMEFDEADVSLLVDAGVFDSVVLHEMGHVYGISRFTWGELGLIDSVEPSCSYKLDSAASSEFQSLSGCGPSIAVPLENDGGAGTFCSHWDEYCVAGELMTGFLSGGLQLSRITIGTLEDIGYEVDYSEAESFTAFNETCIADLCGNRRNLRQKVVEEQTTSRRKVQQEDSGLASAIRYGQGVLDSRKLENPQRLEQMRAAGYEYVGDKVVLIYYLDDEGNVQHVEVTPDTM